jgi:rod shape determining protein RodA
MKDLQIDFIKKYNFRDYHFMLIIPVVILTVIGIMVIGSADQSYQNKQILGMGIGLVIMVLFSMLDYKYLLKYYWLLYFFGLAMLMVVIFAGDKSLGATRWIDLGFVRFQPSELMKIIMILFLAKFLTEHQMNLNRKKMLLKILILIAVPLAMILKQPDLSTTIVMFVLCMCLIFLAGIKAKYVKWALGIGIPGFFVLLFAIVHDSSHKLISQYQYLRIMAWLYPNEYTQSAYQQQNSILAIGSGRLLGKGLYNTSVESVKNGNFISEPQTDFIFAVTGEELGFVGCCAVIGLLLLISIECILIGMKCRRLSGKLIAYGMGILISFQSFVNICVVTGLMPNTGLPLPFVSYGLTSLVTLYMGIGVVLNVGLQRT